jgi:hypothetical protein
MDVQKVVIDCIHTKEALCTKSHSKSARLKKKKCTNDGKHKTHNNCVLVDFATRPHQCKTLQCPYKLI